MPNDPTETNGAQGDIQATDAILQRIKEIDVELAAYIKTIQHADEATFAAMSAHVDELLRERCRAMGLPEDEITRIEQESEAARSTNRRRNPTVQECNLR